MLNFNVSKFLTFLNRLKSVSSIVGVSSVRILEVTT